MTMMLADLSLINCIGSSLNDEERDDILLESAKNNLQVFCVAVFLLIDEFIIVL